MLPWSTSSNGIPRRRGPTSASTVCRSKRQQRCSLIRGPSRCTMKSTASRKTDGSRSGLLRRDEFSWFATHSSQSTGGGVERGSSCVGKPPGARGGSMASEEMRKEYDFSKGVRGKFYRPGLKLSLPVYLDQEAMTFVQRIARKKKTDISTVVNKST